jgi:hypothetical protein
MDALDHLMGLSSKISLPVKKLREKFNNRSILVKLRNIQQCTYITGSNETRAFR